MSSPASTTPSDTNSTATDPAAEAEGDAGIGSSSLSAPPINAVSADSPAGEAEGHEPERSREEHDKGTVRKTEEEPKVNVPITEPILPVEKKPSGPIAAGTSATGAVMQTGETGGIEREHGPSKKCTCLVQ